MWYEGGVMVNVKEKGFGEPSSKPGRGTFYLINGMNPFILGSSLEIK